MVLTQVPVQRTAPAEERREWWRSAACREADPELFFPVAAHGPGAVEIARAKAVCAGCRVRRQCLQYALATRQVHGVWGGTSEDERQLHARRENEREQRDRRELPHQGRAARGGSRPPGGGASPRSVGA
jgi:WhiB family redox-sensing transcriptional regulator